MTQFILARTATGRPALQHSLADDGRATKCGLDSHRWSRAYTETAVTPIIGVADVGRTSEATKILAWPDDIQWPAQSGLSGLVDYGGLHTDAYHPSGVLRLWSREYEFSTTAALSSVTILIRRRNGR